MSLMLLSEVQHLFRLKLASYAVDIVNSLSLLECSCSESLLVVLWSFRKKKAAIHIGG